MRSIYGADSKKVHDEYKKKIEEEKLKESQNAAVNKNTDNSTEETQENDFMTENEKRLYTQKIALISKYEAFTFIKLIESQRLLTYSDVCEIFDFEYEYVRKKMTKRDGLRTFTINSTVRNTLRDYINPIEEKEEETAYPYEEGQNPIKLKRDQLVIEKIKRILENKVYIFESDLKNHLKNTCKLYIAKEEEEYEIISLNEQIASDMIKEKWESFRSLKKKYECDHDMQIHRKLKKSENFIKIMFNEKYGKDRTTRYLDVVRPKV